MSDISTVGTRFNGADLEFYDKTSGTTIFAFRKAAGLTGPINGAETDNITAHAGGGQTNALPLTAAMNRVVTVGSANDSVVLPASVAGMDVFVANAHASNAINVYPASATQGGISGGDAINALGANAAFSVAAGKSATFYCITAGQWHSILSA